MSNSSNSVCWSSLRLRRLAVHAVVNVVIRGAPPMVENCAFGMQVTTEAIVAVRLVVVETVLVIVATGITLNRLLR